MKLGARPMTRSKWLVALSLAALALSAGAGPAVAQGAGASAAAAPKAAEDDTLVLRQRAAEYWAARVAKDYRKQWELSEPRLKGRVTPEEYASGKGAIHYLGYEVGDAKIDNAFASVKVKVIARITVARSRAKPLVKTASVDDAWVKVDGVWYRRADQPDSGAPPAPAPPGPPQRSL